MNNILDFIKKNRIIAILRGIDKDKLIPLCEAMYEGGIRVIEIPFTDDTKTAESIGLLTRAFGDKMCIGAGTVLTKEQLNLSIQNGAKFIVSPNINPEIVISTKQAKLVSIPGALTPTEVALCMQSGADIIKLFPAGNMGTEYFKQLKAPFGNVCMYAFGGVKPKDIKGYLNVGAGGFGISSGIVDNELLSAGNYKQITKNAYSYVKELL